MEIAETVLNVGVSGFGKSYIQGYDIERHYSNGIFPIIVEKKDDHEQLAKSLGFKRFNVGSRTARNLEAEKLKKILEKVRNSGAGGVVFSFKRDDFELKEQDLIKFINELSNALLVIKWKNLLVLEEIANYCPSQSNDSDFYYLRKLINEGRSVGTLFGGTCQMPQQVHFKIFQSTNIYRVFGLGNNDNKYKKLGIKGGLREKMKDWKRDDFKYLYLNENKGLKEIRSSEDISRRTQHSG